MVNGKLVTNLQYKWGHLPSFIEEHEIEFLEKSSTKLLPPEALVVLVAFVIVVALVVFLVRALELSVVILLTRPCVAGLPGLGRVNESLESMRLTEFISGLSETVD